jgi:hypothetical protein
MFSFIKTEKQQLKLYPQGDIDEFIDLYRKK